MTQHIDSDARLGKRTLLTAAIFAAAVTAYAATAEESEDSAPPPGKPTEVFQPTEEISEDYAVAFPVDI